MERRIKWAEKYKTQYMGIILNLSYFDLYMSLYVLHIFNKTQGQANLLNLFVTCVFKVTRETLDTAQALLDHLG